MKLSNDQLNILHQAVDTYGKASQLDMVIEEAAELIVEVQKLKRNRPSDINQEIADVFIMLTQLQMIIGEGCQHEIDLKVERLKNKLNGLAV